MATILILHPLATPVIDDGEARYWASDLYSVDIDELISWVSDFKAQGALFTSWLHYFCEKLAATREVATASLVDGPGAAPLSLLEITAQAIEHICPHDCPIHKPNYYHHAPVMGGPGHYTVNGCPVDD